MGSLDAQSRTASAVFEAERVVVGMGLLWPAAKAAPLKGYWWVWKERFVRVFWIAVRRCSAYVASWGPRPSPGRMAMVSGFWSGRGMVKFGKGVGCRGAMRVGYEYEYLLISEIGMLF